MSSWSSKPISTWVQARDDGTIESWFETRTGAMLVMEPCMNSYEVHLHTQGKGFKLFSCKQREDAEMLARDFMERTYGYNKMDSDKPTSLFDGLRNSQGASS